MFRSWRDGQISWQTTVSNVMQSQCPTMSVEILSSRTLPALWFDTGISLLDILRECEGFTASLTLSVTAGREDGARRSEDVRQVPGEAFHPVTGFSLRITLYGPRSSSWTWGKCDDTTSDSWFQRFLTEEDGGKIPCLCLLSSPAGGREDGLFCPALVGGVCDGGAPAVHLSSYWSTLNLLV